MNRKILVVDDEGSIREVCARILRTAKYEVDTAGGISEAMGKLRSADYGLVLTDLRMGEDRGEDLIKMVKERSPETGVFIQFLVNNNRFALGGGITAHPLSEADFFAESFFPVLAARGRDDKPFFILVPQSYRAPVGGELFFGSFQNKV